MKDSKIFIFMLFCEFIFVAGCYDFQHPPFLTKESIQRFMQNRSAENEVYLIPKIYTGRTGVPATDPMQKFLVGFQFTGETCSVTVNKNSTISVNFIDDKAISLFAPPKFYQSDIYLGELSHNQVLIIQHNSKGEMVSLTQTIYDSNGNVVYGVHGKGDYIKECMFNYEREHR